MDKKTLKIILSPVVRAFKPKLPELQLSIIKYLADQPLLPDEDQATILLFSQNNEVYISIAAIDANNKIVRQIQTKKFTEFIDLLLSFL